MQVWSKVSRMPAQGIKKMQSELLEAMVKQLAAGHPFYRQMFQEIAVNVDTFSAADLNKLPFTTKEDILAPPDDPSHPKKFVLEAPPEEKSGKKGGFKLFGKKEEKAGAPDYQLKSLYYTAGRTAKPVPIVYTELDLDNLKEAGKRAYDLWGMTRDDTIVNAFSFAPNVSFWQIYYSGMEMGATALHAGGGRVLGMEKILRALNNMEAPVLAASPGYAQFALQTMTHFGFNLSSLERIIVGNDYTPVCQVERLKNLMAGVMAKETLVQRIYFLSEAKSGWAECELGQGYHINPDHALVEIIDPESGEVKGEREAGEVVITNLSARGTIFLRFRTGDIATGGMTTQPCEKCGRTVPRILGDIERRALYFELQGESGPLQLNGNELRHFMIEQTDVLQWYAELAGSGAADVIKVVLKLSKEVGDEKAYLEHLAGQLLDRFRLPSTVETSSLAAIINKTGLERGISEQRIFDLRTN